MTNTENVTFESVFDRGPQTQTTTPGRVNLIGEHIDYTGGVVLPTVIPNRVRVETAPAATGGEKLRFFSTRFDELIERPLDDALTGAWSDYILAGHRKAVQLGLAKGGADYFVDSDIPHGAGVSSSAALLVGVLRAAAQSTQQSISPEKIALWAQEVEVEDIGVPCGIMDQMAVALGKKGHALVLDTATLSYELIPLFEDYVFPIFHSGLTRTLADGHYKERRDATETAAAALGVRFLSKADETARKRLQTLTDPVRQRARHVISEHQRVLAAVDALKDHDTERFGRLMGQSHASMRDDFEITPPEMDEMTDYAVQSGALGSRLTGGGFGGCFVSLVKTDMLTSWKEKMTARFSNIRLVSDGV